MINKEEYQDKKLIAFDLYGTCIEHIFGDFRLSRETVKYFKTHPISLEEYKQKNLESIKQDTTIFDNLILDVKRSID